MKRLLVGLLAFSMLLTLGCQKEPAQQSGELNVEVLEDPPEPTPEQTPAVETAPEDTYICPYANKIAEALDINPDVVGWISIPGTNIDYPILYGQKWYYADHNINREGKTSGSVYSHLNMASYEYHNTDQNLVVSATNARISRTLFHELHHVQEVNLGKTTCAFKKCGATLDPAALPNFSTEAGRTWDISVCGIEAQWEVWAMYETEADEPDQTLYYNTWFPGSDYKFIPQSEQDVQKWIDEQLGRSQYDFGVDATTDDQFLTLYTAGDNHDSSTAQSRLYFFLKQVNPASTKFKAGVRVGETTATEDCETGD